MNWLIYIGGGIFFVGAGLSIMSGGNRKWEQIDWLRLTSLFFIWIWICWRFIS